MFEANPDANIGIATGAVSGFVVLDVDPDKGGLKSILELQNVVGAMPKTPRVLTGGRGEHWYFQYPGSVLKNRVGLAGYPGLDFRADGGYVVAPPSNHKSGNLYEFMVGCAPAGISKDGVELAELPMGMVEIVRERPASTTDDYAHLETIPDGQRHDAMMRLAGALRRRGLGKDAIYAALLAEDKRLCSPPISNEDGGDSELLAMAEYCAERSAEAPVVSMPPGVLDGPSASGHPASAPSADDPNDQLDGIHPNVPRIPTKELIMEYMTAPGGPEFAFKYDLKLYSKRDRAWYTARQWRDNPSREIFHLLLARSEDISDAEATAALMYQKHSAARKAWNMWTISAFMEWVKTLPEKAETDDTTASEDAEFAAAVRAALTKELSIGEGASDLTIRSSVFEYSLNQARPSWSQVGHFGAYCKVGPRIAIRYDFLIAHGGAQIKKYTKSTLARRLNKFGIAKSNVAISGTRVYVVDDEWLANNFEVEIAKESSAPEPAAFDAKKAAAGDTEEKNDDVPF